MAGRTRKAVDHKDSRVHPERSAAAAPQRGRVSGTTAPSGPAAELEAIVVSHWFDPGKDGEPYPATVRLHGRRSGVSGTPRPADRFEQITQLARVVPGSGPISVTSRIFDVQAGEWSVTAELTKSQLGVPERRGAGRAEAEQLRSTSWSWRHWSIVPGSYTTLATTRWQALAKLVPAPGMLPGAVPVLVAIGGLIAVLSQARFVSDYGFPVGAALLVTLVASLFGLLGAKVWYAVLHPLQPLLVTGWAVDGFLVIAPIAAIVSLVVLGLPVGAYLDATAPGLFFAVAVGRVGCFLTGCCAGRATHSRLGIWSSDMLVGARRVPSQLMESAIGLAIGLTALGLLTRSPSNGTGFVFAVTLAAYLLARHFLLRVRAERRSYLWHRNSSLQPIRG